MDQITIEGLEVFYHVGVPKTERAKAQRLLISLTLETPFARAQATDDLNETIDYSAIAIGLTEFGKGRSWQLIERLANDIAEWILSEFRPLRVTVEIKKFIIPNTQHVAVKLTREP